MPNILADEKVIPEFVMGDANAGNIAKEAVALLKDPSKLEEMKRKIKGVAALLGSPGVIEKVARGILDFVK